MRRLPAPRGQRAASIQNICVASRVLIASVSLAGALFASTALAEPMDPILSRLRIVGSQSTCPASERGWCKNAEQFERLVSELGVSIAPPLVSPAASDGPSGLGLSLDMTLTSLDANAGHWQNGTLSPDPVLVWTHATLRKGLPFGLEVGTTIGRGHGTSLWSLGLSLKWAIVEGFRTGAGVLPDVALQGTTTRSMGLDDLTLATHTLDLLLSKPLHVGRGYRIAPMLGVQMLFVEAESGLVDLTPGVDPSVEDETVEDIDAFQACKPGVPETGEAAPLTCTDQAADFTNNVQFDDVDQARVRLFIGGQLQFGVFRFSTSLGFDLMLPELQAQRAAGDSNPMLARQLAFTLAAGAVL
jgi:hypothetical protein